MRIEHRLIIGPRMRGWTYRRPVLHIGAVPTSIDIVLPCLNEERILPQSVRRLHAFLSAEMTAYTWSIVIADNGSTDGTRAVAIALSEELSAIRYTHLTDRGRGRALRRAWTASRADIVAYMDVDLSTDLARLPALVEAIANEEYHIAIGSRLLPESRVTGRTLVRECTSRTYSLLFRSMFWTAFRDAQCGFKAVSRSVADDLVPQVRGNGWFFDSELLILAQKCGYRIRELPVHWNDDLDSRVRILPTAWEQVRGLLRLRFGGVKRVQRQLRAVCKA